MSAKEPYPDDHWGRTFVPERAREVLEGNTSSLPAAFIWENTKEGHKYWENQFFRGDGLTDLAQEKVRFMLESFDPER